MKDPTRDEMLAFLATVPFASEFDEFDREEAIYWFAYAWHGGQSSNLYAALCNSPYDPGPVRNGCDGPSEMLLGELEGEFGP